MSSKKKQLELDKKYEEERKNRVYLTKEEVDALSPEEIAEAKVRGAMLGFFESLIDGNVKEAYMCLGTLRSADVPDLPYYYATLKQYEKDYTGALEEYKKIEKDSEKYSFAVENIERIYELTGNYEELSKLLSADEVQSDATKFEKRLMCLMYAKDRPVEELEALINQFPFEVINGMKKDDEDEEETHIKICKMICNCLVAAGTCIDNVGTYAERMKDKQIDYTNDQNIQVYIAAYKRTIMFLKAMNSYRAVRIQTGEEVYTFDRIALASKGWSEKIQILRTGEYHAFLAGLIVQLLNPQRFPTAEPITLVYQLLDVLIQINPAYIQKILSLYWEDIKKAIADGDYFAVKYINIAYGQIVATNRDHHKIKSRLEEIVKTTPEINPSEQVKWSRIMYSLTREGYEAFLHAERQYKLNEEKIGTENASELALMYFKVFEHEYNKRLIHPMLKEIDVERMEKLDEAQCGKEWWEEIENVRDILYGDRKSNLMIGEIRTLLNKIWKVKGQRSNLFANALYKVLTPQGVYAFESRRMIDLIGKSKADEYRNPGAHTEYLPFTSASEAKEYVTNNIPMMEGWFKK